MEHTKLINLHSHCYFRVESYSLFMCIYLNCPSLVMQLKSNSIWTSQVQQVTTSMHSCVDLSQDSANATGRGPARVAMLVTHPRHYGVRECIGTDSAYEDIHIYGTT